MTPGAMVVAAGKVNGRAKPRAVNRRPGDYLQYA